MKFSKVRRDMAHTTAGRPVVYIASHTGRSGRRESKKGCLHARSHTHQWECRNGGSGGNNLSCPHPLALEHRRSCSAWRASCQSSRITFCGACGGQHLGSREPRCSREALAMGWSRQGGEEANHPTTPLAPLACWCPRPQVQAAQEADQAHAQGGCSARCGLQGARVRGSRSRKSPPGWRLYFFPARRLVAAAAAHPPFSLCLFLGRQKAQRTRRTPLAACKWQRCPRRSCGSSTHSTRWGA